jgi:AGCS family alanine or glycine:cation symporter
MDFIIQINDKVNNFAWGTFGLILMLGTGLICTVITGFFQITHLRHWFKKTFGIMNSEGRIINDAGALSQFRTFCTALCATIGTGNIAGVATAICVGGPGAVFWMWVAAFFGMMVKYSENVLGMYYRRRNQEGAWSGGPMYYLEDGLGSIKNCKKLGRFLGIVFCIFTVLASFGIGNMGQINKITINFESTFLSDVNLGMFMGLPRVNLMIGVVLMIAVAVILMGGFRRLAAVSEKLIPTMTVAYIVGCLVIILMNISVFPAAIGSIFKFALGPDAVKGGVAGSAIQLALNTVKSGCKRGVFSNEAGLGSSVMVHSSSNVREPVVQGMWGIFEVFADTIIVCTLTAFAVLSSGLVDLETGTVLSDQVSTALVAEAFSTIFGKAGSAFIAIAILFFAFSTVLGWSQYGSKGFEYLFGTKAIKFYQVVFVVFIFVGATMDLSLAWDLSDTFNGMMAIPNLIGVIALSGTVMKITQNYVDRKIKGKDVKPMLSAMEDIQELHEKEIAS